MKREIVKTCEICGETFRAYSYRAKYCAHCRKIAQFRAQQAFRRRAGKREKYSIQTCSQCGKEYVYKGGHSTRCDDCRAKVEASPKEFTCEICGKTFEKHNRRKQRMCVTKCEPMAGLRIKCTECGEMLPYEAFYDYRGGSREGFRRVCRKCLSKKVLKKYHERVGR